MSGDSFNALIRWLGTPAAYPHAPKRVDVVETHISVVFLAGEFAYKLKRQVKYDFLDFTTLAKREQACRDEVRLNRRLAPDIYLGIVPVTRGADGAWRLGGDGAVIDWLVHMRRLPVEQTLDAILCRGELRPSHIDQLAQVLAEFYRSLPPSPLTPPQYLDRYAAHVRSNLEELLGVSHHCPTNIVRRVHGFQLQLLHLQSELFDTRVQSGRIVEGHGDLRPEHICFTDPPVIFDCIEFNLDFRRIDVADELAFLAAECDFQDAPWIGRQLFKTMEVLSGDHPPQILIDFYKSYRACVRAKVNALRADQLAGVERDKAAAASQRHLQFASSYAQQWQRPLLVLVGGMSGTGKSTLAGEIASTLGCELLQTDAIRQELFGVSERPATYADDNYSREARQRVYAELLRRAKSLHADGVPLVLDGTFSMADTLCEVQQLASDPRTVFLAIQCVCDPDIARQRMAKRLSKGASRSEMRPELFDQQLATWESWPESLPQCRIDTQQSLDAQLAAALAELKVRF